MATLARPVRLDEPFFKVATRLGLTVAQTLQRAADEVTNNWFAQSNVWKRPVATKIRLRLYVGD
jgi:hypothetical protein